MEGGGVPSESNKATWWEQNIYCNVFCQVRPYAGEMPSAPSALGRVNSPSWKLF